MSHPLRSLSTRLLWAGEPLHRGTCGTTSGSAAHSPRWSGGRGHSLASYIKALRRTRYDIWQSERGERSGRLMLGLYSLAGLQAVHTVQARLRDGENVFAYLVCVF